MTSQPDLSVVFPVYNEEGNVPILLDEIAAALRGHPWSYEMVAVDDGSSDGSLEILRQSRAKYPNLRVLTFEKNSGQTAALDAAWRAARPRKTARPRCRPPRVPRRPTATPSPIRPPESVRT